MLARNIDHGSMFRQPRRVGILPVASLEIARLDTAIQTYVTRRVPRSCMATLLMDHSLPSAGDLVLARVSTTDRFDFVESAEATMSLIESGEEVVVCFGGRNESTDVATDVMQLINPAGIAAQVTKHHPPLVRTTGLEYIGRLGDAKGRTLNISQWAIPSGLGLYISQPIIALISERHLPGESCRAADIIRGLSGAGFKVGAANVTGVPGCWKTGLLRNAGAHVAVDITDAGYVGIEGQDPEVLERIFLALSGYLAASGADIMVLEIEQGVFGHDTAAIISMPSFQSRISTVILEGRDGTVSELERDSLRAMGFDVTLVDDPGHRTRYQRLI
jgi:hypothetical protein